MVRARHSPSLQDQTPAFVHATAARPQGGEPLLLAEDVFLDALQREFKRADRFEEAFALLLVTVDHRCTDNSRRELVEGVIGAVTDADIVGWFEQDTVVGLIRTLGKNEAASAVAALTAAVQVELLRAVGAERPGTCSIRLEVCSTRSRVSAISLPAPRQKSADVAVRMAKRALDVAGSAALLCLLSPIFLAVSGLIKLTSRGAVLFKQVRVGQDGRLFTMLKFRTMHANVEPALHQQYVTQFIQAGDQKSMETVFKLVNDPRVTSVGHFLRRSSLDELPQFLNVLRGDMSLVGPRPPLPYEVERYKPWHVRRLHEAKPGITGLWQVKGRSRTTFDEMVRLDLQYARKQGLWEDIKILLATPRAVVSGKGAH